MSNRTDLTHHRTAITAVDAGLLSVRGRCVSLSARVRIARAQGLLRAALAELELALVHDVDPAIEHTRRPHAPRPAAGAEVRQ